MKVLLTLDYPPEIGGIQAYLFGYVALEYSNTDKVFVGSLFRNRETDTQERDSLVTYMQIPQLFRNKKWALFPLFFKVALFPRNTISLLECGNIYTGLLGYILCFFNAALKYRVFTYGTELLSLHRRSFKSWVFKKVLCRANAIYVLGTYTQSLVRKSAITTPCTVITPMLSIPLAEIERRCAVAQNIRSKNTTVFRIVCVGRLFEHKGQEILIKACALLNATYPLKLILIGDGPNKSLCVKEIAKAQLTDIVTILSNASPSIVLSEYEQAHCVVVPSKTTQLGTEGFGIVCLEAMSFGVPLVVSDCGGLPEVVADSALIFKQGDVNALALALTTLLLNPAVVINLSHKGKNRLCSTYLKKPL